MKKNYHLPFIITTLFFLLVILNVIWQFSIKSLVAASVNQFLIQNSNAPSANDSSASDNFEYNTNNSSSDCDIYSADSSDTADSKKRIALTFDDGPHPVYTLKLLDGLKKRNVKATFFVIGSNVKEHPEILQKISEDGHIIGNHTYSHVQLSCISESKACEEITKTNTLIEEYTKTKVKYIRPPYGSLPKSLAKETSLTPVLWTIDPRDWSVLNTDSIVKHIVSHAKDGDIILLHDIFETSVDAALIVIDKLTEEGFEFVTVDELIDN